MKISIFFFSSSSVGKLRRGVRSGDPGPDPKIRARNPFFFFFLSSLVRRRSSSLNGPRRRSVRVYACRAERNVSLCPSQLYCITDNDNRLTVLLITIIYSYQSYCYSIYYYYYFVKPRKRLWMY